MSSTQNHKVREYLKKKYRKIANVPNKLCKESVVHICKGNQLNSDQEKRTEVTVLLAQ